MEARNMKLGNILVQAGLINTEQLEAILQNQTNKNKKLGELVVEAGYASDEEIVQLLEYQLGIPSMDLNKFYVDPEIPKVLNENLARKYIVLPVGIQKDSITVAMADPLNIIALDDIAIATGFSVLPVIAKPKDILAAIDLHYGKQRAEKVIEEFKNEFFADTLDEIDPEELNNINSAPVVKLVNSIISQAVKMRASDIHIEPFESILRVRYRIDGELQEIVSPSKAAHSALVTRIKIMGKMDIAEKRVPQDGRIETDIDGREIDMRISSLPTVYGEKIVIRLLDRSNFLTNKSNLGMTPKNMEAYDKIIMNPNGIILVTGPTGSGKSTTLYATLKELNKDNINIITVEDPVEYKLNGINQVQVNPKAGLTFANGLRSILRQDPDIIMIGEIRDGETAEIAVRAAITGHLVLSTVHTNDAPSTLTRLIDMGVEPYLVSSSLVGVISQRLVRRICNNCREPYELDDREAGFFDKQPQDIVYHGKGCELCNKTGYKGRIAVHEVMPITKEIRAMINNRRSVDDIRDLAYKTGTDSLKENCKKLVLEGITTVEEMIKISYNLE
ncbi:MAG: type secretion system protein GspE [Clostridia bacterium]|jgi:type IV pilus assembly protein PilB|nr:type secretion system protein GspE [Clostridia bacterium]